MAKQSALSIRILQSIKRDIDKAAAREHRSTSSLVEKILADYLQAAKTGKPRKYLDLDEAEAHALVGQHFADWRSTASRPTKSSY